MRSAKKHEPQSETTAYAVVTLAPTGCLEAKIEGELP